MAALVDLSQGEGGAAPGMKLQDVQDIIRQAVGFKTNRDEIKVTDVKLVGGAEATASDQEWDKIQLWQNVANIVRNASLGIAALVGLVLGWMVFRRLRPAPAPAPTPSPQRTLRAERLSQAVQQNPAAVARALSVWLENLSRPQQGAA